jgi:hypothetical protein
MSEDEVTIWCNGGPHHGETMKLRGLLPPFIRLAIRSGSVLDGVTDEPVIKPATMRVATYKQHRDTKRYDWVKP